MSGVYRGFLTRMVNLYNDMVEIYHFGRKPLILVMTFIQQLLHSQPRKTQICHSCQSSESIKKM